MTQDQLDRLVAEATGEDLTEIEHLGFTLVTPEQIDFDPDPEPVAFPLTIDFDRLDLLRNTSLLPQPFTDRRVA